MTDKKVIGYMCVVDFKEELGEASGGTKVYASIEDLRAHAEECEDCRIVEVEVSFVRAIEPSEEEQEYMTPDQVIEAEVDRYIAKARRNITGACNYVDWINYDHPKAKAFFAELRAEGWYVFEYYGTRLCPGRSLCIQAQQQGD